MTEQSLHHEMRVERSALHRYDVIDKGRKFAVVTRLWETGSPLAGTIAETYLRDTCGIRLDLSAADLRFAYSAPVKPSWRLGTPMKPAIVAAVRDDKGEIVAAHLIYLSWEDPGQAARHVPRVYVGQKAGGAIHLAPVQPSMVIGIGVENTLAASEACGLPAIAAVDRWSLTQVPLPRGLRRVLIAFSVTEYDEQEHAARRLALTLQRTRVKATLLPPPQGFRSWVEQSGGKGSETKSDNRTRIPVRMRARARNSARGA
jgi:hypothetical protein